MEIRPRRMPLKAIVSGLVLLALTGAIAAPTALATPTPTLVTEPYIIGSGSLSNIQVSISNNSTGASTVYVVSFITPAELVGGSAHLIITDPTGRTSFPSVAGDYSVVNPGGSGGGTVSSVSVSPGSVNLVLPGTIAAGGQVQVVISGVTNPLTPGTYYLEVSTSQSSAPADSPAYAITGSALAGNCSSASSPLQPTSPALAGEAGVFYCMPNLRAASALSSLDVSLAGASFPNGVTSDYTVYDLTKNQQIPVTSVTASSGAAVIALGSPGIGSGDSFDLGILDVINPSTAGSVTASVASTSGAPTYTYATGVSNLAISINPLSAGAQANYAVSFRVTTAIPGGGTVTLAAPTGTIFPSNAAQYSLADTPNPSGLNGQLASYLLAGGGTATVTITMPREVYAGDTLTITILGVINPPAGNYSGQGAPAGQGFFVSTSTDTAKVASPAYTIAPSTTSTSSVKVTVSSSVPGAVANYTFGILAAGNGGLGSGSSIEIDAPSGTVFPGVGSDYQIEDLSNPAQSGPPAAISYDATTNQVVITIAKPLAQGDDFEISINGVTNPQAGTYTAGLVGNIAPGKQPTRPTTTTTTTTPSRPKPPVVVFPTAADSHPNGALVETPRGGIYFFAGGKAFPITNRAMFALVRRSDPAVVVRGTVTAAEISGRMREGTVVQIAGRPAFWVVGPHGRLHSFRSIAQYLADGYDPAQKVVIPYAANLSVSPTPPPNAAQVMADGALVQAPNGAVHVLAGGKALPIPNLSLLVAVERADHAHMIRAVLPPSAFQAKIADGVLFKVPGAGGVYVSYGGKRYVFSSLAQLREDGYIGAYVLPVAGVAVVPIG